MFNQDAGVLKRHVPAAEIGSLGTKSNMAAMKWGLLQG